MYHAILLVCAMANTMTLCARGYEAKYQQAPHLSYVDPNIPPQGQLHLPINHIESYTPYHLFAKQHPELTSMQYETLIK